MSISYYATDTNAYSSTPTPEEHTAPLSSSTPAHTSRLAASNVRSPTRGTSASSSRVRRTATPSAGPRR
ncbi:hypothetical protein ACEPAI_3108 [Sanghuangporus weigelae]